MELMPELDFEISQQIIYAINPELYQEKKQDTECNIQEEILETECNIQEEILETECNIQKEILETECNIQEENQETKDIIQDKKQETETEIQKIECNKILNYILLLFLSGIFIIYKKIEK